MSVQTVGRIFILAATCIPFLLNAEQQAHENTQNKWFDSVEREITDSIGDTAIWFDNFFSDEEITDSERAEAEARIRLGWEPRSRDFSEHEARFRVRFKLPNMKRQTDLIFSDYDDEEQASAVKAARNEAIDNRNRFNLALRWISSDQHDIKVSHRIGVGRKLQPYVKSKVQHTVNLSEIRSVNLEASVYYYSQDRFGTHIAAKYDQQMGEKGLFRFDNHFYFRDEENDWIWQHSWSHYWQFSDKKAYIFGLYLEGTSRPNYRIEEYLLSTRWRKNALREWLYFELEPFVLWRRDEDFRPSYGIGLRVEGRFGES